MEPSWFHFVPDEESGSVDESLSSVADRRIKLRQRYPQARSVCSVGRCSTGPVVSAADESGNSPPRGRARKGPAPSPQHIGGSRGLPLGSTRCLRSTNKGRSANSSSACAHCPSVSAPRPDGPARSTSPGCGTGDGSGATSVAIGTIACPWWEGRNLDALDQREVPDLAGPSLAQSQRAIPLRRVSCPLS